MDLAYWQERLAEHFQHLRELRGDWPVFAFEHGLDDGERGALGVAVQAADRKGVPRSSASLPWVVYATEFGYKYSGESFWPAFEAATPGWREHDNRTWLRSAFQHFATAYNGVEPRSDWAKHFTIICWPITHAILPTDLQRQLVYLLFQLRFSFSSGLFSSAAELGRYIHQYSDRLSSRLQELAENESLLGQIAGGLLLGEAAAASLLLPETLKRITADISAERAAGTWLSETRRRISKLQVRGLSSVRPRIGPAPAKQPVAAIRLEASLSLVQVGNGKWHAWVKLPSLMPVGDLWPDVRPFLAAARALLLDGDEERPLARGKLLSGSDERLTHWPEAGAACIQVPQASQQLQAVLNGIRFPIEETSFFQVVENGRAIHRVSGKVRPGEQYILVRRSPLNGVDLEEVTIGTAGAYAYNLIVPELLDEHSTKLLQRLETAADSHVSVWPSGAGAAAWDDDGYCEILTGEQLVLGVSVDLAVTGLRARVDDGLVVDLPYSPGGDGTVFLGFGVLEPGEHSIALDLLHGPEITKVGTLRVIVRGPGSSGRTSTSTSAIVLRSWPTQPSLEQLWEGAVEIAVAGPLGARARCCVELWKSEATESLGKKEFTISVPCTPEEWRSTWVEEVVGDKSLAEKYDASGACILSISARGLGRPTLIARRQLMPLRWHVRNEDDDLAVQLLNDSEDAPSRVHFYPFDRPDAASQLVLRDTLAGIKIPGPGGLFLASGGQHRALTIGAAPLVLKSLDELSLRVVLRALGRRPADLLAYLEIAALWAGARLQGAQSAGTLWRTKVLRSLLGQVVGVIAGPKWEAAEQSVLYGERDVADLAGLVAPGNQQLESDLLQLQLGVDLSPIAISQALAWVCRRRLPDACIALGAQVSHKIGKGKARRIDQSSWTCQFALRLCSAPHTVSEWAGDRLSAGITRLVAQPSLLRAARYVHLALSLPSKHGPQRKEEVWLWE